MLNKLLSFIVLKIVVFVLLSLTLILYPDFCMANSYVGATSESFGKYIKIAAIIMYVVIIIFAFIKNSNGDVPIFNNLTDFIISLLAAMFPIIIIWFYQGNLKQVTNLENYQPKIEQTQFSTRVYATAKFKREVLSKIGFNQLSHISYSPIVPRVEVVQGLDSDNNTDTKTLGPKTDGVINVFKNRISQSEYGIFMLIGLVISFICGILSIKFSLAYNDKILYKILNIITKIPLIWICIVAVPLFLFLYWMYAVRKAKYDRAETQLKRLIGAIIITIVAIPTLVALSVENKEFVSIKKCWKGE
jgi:hypothetical protein